jgi:hypothetical protein
MEAVGVDVSSYAAANRFAGGLWYSICVRRFGSAGRRIRPSDAVIISFECGVLFSCAAIAPRAADPRLGRGREFRSPLGLSDLCGGARDRRRIVGGYWHSGDLDALDTADLNGYGVTEIYLAGVDQGRQQATLVVLDPRRVNGIGSCRHSVGLSCTKR